MDHRLFAILVAVCFALAGVGCASEAQREKNKRAMLLPRQTGSNLDRRIIPSESSDNRTKKSKKKKESKRTSAKPPAPEKPPQKPEDESTTPPDRFR